MKTRRLIKSVRIIGAASVLIMSGCATAFVRSKSTVDPQHVFPATTFDAKFFWNSGVKGEPLFATVEPNDRTGPARRLAYGAGGIIDLPFSLVFDIVLLPFDLSRQKTSSEDDDTKNKPN